MRVFFLVTPRSDVITYNINVSPHTREVMSIFKVSWR